jgi:hypothetical protein
MNNDIVKKSRKENELSESCLLSLTVVGRILLFTPFIIGLSMLIYSLVTNNNIEMPGVEIGAYATGLLCTCGVIILVYVSIKKFQKSKNGTDATNGDDAE